MRRLLSLIRPIRKYRNPAARSRAASKVRPTLEGLEGRELMTAMPNVQVAEVYLGSYWQQNGFEEYLLYLQTQAIVNSPYMDALGSAGYGTIGRGNVDKVQTLGLNLPSGSTITDTQVRQDLFLDIIFGGLPAPNDNRLYVIHTPPDVTFTATGSDGTTYSSNTNLTGWNASFYILGTNIHYVVIPFPGGTNVSANGRANLDPNNWRVNLDAYTESLSHEIAEAVAGVQIADQTERYHVRMQNGVAVQEFGSVADLTKPVPVPGATSITD
jgi:hypothetical protein